MPHRNVVSVVTSRVVFLGLDTEFDDLERIVVDIGDDNPLARGTTNLFAAYRLTESGQRTLPVSGRR